MIDPVAFEIGPLQLHWYGIIIAGAVLIGGLATLGVTVAWARVFGVLWRLDRFPHAEPDAPDGTRR